MRRKFGGKPHHIKVPKTKCDLRSTAYKRFNVAGRRPTKPVQPYYNGSHIASGYTMSVFKLSLQDHWSAKTVSRKLETSVFESFTVANLPYRPCG